MNRHHKRDALPAGIAIELDSASVIALATAHEHLQIFPKQALDLLTLSPDRLKNPVLRTQIEGLPWIRHAELFTAAYFGVLLLGRNAAEWRARVSRVSRLIATGKLQGDGMPQVGNNLRFKTKGRRILEDSAATEYGLPDANAVDAVFSKLEVMAAQLDMTFNELCDTNAYIQRAIRNKWPNWECPTEEELKVLATGPAYLTDMVGRSRALKTDGVVFAANGDWLLVVHSVSESRVKAAAVYPPELLVCGFENEPPKDPPRTPPNEVLADIATVCEKHFPGSEVEISWMHSSAQLSGPMDQAQGGA